MRILVAEPVAEEGVELLRAHHEVDERPGLSARRAVRDPARLRRAHRPQPGPGRCRADRRRDAARRSSAGPGSASTTSTSRPRRGPGIIVVNAPTGNTIAAAEHTLALLYGVARRIAAADASLRRGEWKRAQFTGLELRGRTLGIVGLGKIGQAIAVRARAMEMTVIGVDPFVTAEQAANHGVELVEFDELLARADVVTVHVPLTRADARADRPRGDRQAQARLDRAQRRPRRRHRRGGRRRGASVGPPRRRRASTSSSTSRRPTRRCSTRRTRC